MSHGNGRPLGNRPSPADLQAMLRQQAPRPPQIDIATFKFLKCDCGSVKMEQYSFAILKTNPLAPQEFATIPMQACRCFACKKHPVFKDGAWTFQTEEPPLNLE